jgi:hypothetical protein
VRVLVEAEALETRLDTSLVTIFPDRLGAGAGSAEAPAMFNLADLMKGQKQAADAQLLNDALLSGAMIGGPMAAVAAPMNAWAAPDDVKGEAFLRPALNLGVGATGGGAVGHLGGALLGRATGNRTAEDVLRGLGTLSGAVGGSLAMNNLSQGLIPYSDRYDAWLEGGGVPEKRASEASTALLDLVDTNAFRNAAAFAPLGAAAGAGAGAAYTGVDGMVNGTGPTQEYMDRVRANMLRGAVAGTALGALGGGYTGRQLDKLDALTSAPLAVPAGTVPNI